ncbi:DUF998 domain-containing protein [Allorhizocola rhizosphaerae]|uniref:DUF998 domain-containing protein n=1 Tax=Allorhizocola rhizosphaerae TaxID=1872709 RepID=UPI000E3D7AE7|nr:DUF998 domain-containing protein [Allorhizocola rhizosphaerae]
MTTTLIAVAPPPPPRPGRSRHRLLLACGLVAGPLFVAAFALHGAFREGYDPLRHPVSSLAFGPWGWVQVANFIVSGLLTLAFAVGLRRASGLWLGPLLVAVWGVGLIGAGAFITDPVSGYPPGTPPIAAEPTWHGFLHAADDLAARDQPLLT